MADDTIQVKITGAMDGLNKALSDAGDAVKDGAEQMKGAIEGITAQFLKFNMAGEAVKNLLAGGELFSGAIADANKMNLEMEQLSLRLGKSANDAAILDGSLRAIGSSGSEYAGAIQSMTMKMEQNEDAFKANGIATRDSNGQMRDAGAVLQDTIAKINDMSGAHDKAAAELALLGSNWSSYMALARLTPEALAATKQAHEELGLVITQDGIESTYKYMAAMSDADDVFDSVKLHISQELLPQLTDMGNWFASIGPQVVETCMYAFDAFENVVKTLADTVMVLWHLVSDAFSGIGTIIASVMGQGGSGFAAMDWFKIALIMVQDAVIGLRVGFEIAFELIESALASAVAYVMRFANVAAHALKGDFSGAKQAWKDGTKEIEDITEQSNKRLIEIAEKGKADMDKIAEQTAAHKDIKQHGKEEQQPSGKSHFVNVKDKDGKQKDSGDIKMFETGLIAQKTLFMEQNNMYEQSKAADLAYWESILTRTDLSEKQRAAIEKKASDLKIQIMKEGAKTQLAMTQESIEEQKKASLDAVSLAQQEAEQKQAMGLISKQELLQQQQQFENERYQIELKALQDRLALAKLDPANPAALQKLQDQELALTRKHAADMKKLQGQLQLEKNSPLLKLGDQMKDSFSDAISDMILKGHSLRTTLNGIYQSLGSEFTKTVTKMGTDWAALKIKQLAASMGFFGEEKAAQTTSSTTTLATKATEAEGVVGANAAEAASGAASSVASIPYVGWAMAAAAFASVLGMVMGAKSSIPSAAGGYDIPAGVNPLAQLHQREMVLPAKHADVIRALADKGGSAGGGDVHMHVHTQSTGDFKKFMSKNSHTLAPAIRRMARNAMPTKA